MYVTPQSAQFAGCSTTSQLLQLISSQGWQLFDDQNIYINSAASDNKNNTDF